MATKNTKKSNIPKPSVQIRVRISADHHEALKQMQASTGFPFPALTQATFIYGMPSMIRRFGADAETN